MPAKRPILSVAVLAGPAQILWQQAQALPCFPSLCDLELRKGPEQAMALSCGAGECFGLGQCVSPALTSQHSPDQCIGTAEHFICLQDSGFAFVIGRTALLCVGSSCFLFPSTPAVAVFPFPRKHCL